MYNAVIMIAVILGVAGLTRGALVSEATAIQALQKSGYTDIQIESSAWFAVGLRGCSEKDAARFVASATNPNGAFVEKIIVCSGWPLKGVTIRF